MLVQWAQVPDEQRGTAGGRKAQGSNAAFPAVSRGERGWDSATMESWSARGLCLSDSGPFSIDFHINSLIG